MKHYHTKPHPSNPFHKNKEAQLRSYKNNIEKYKKQLNISGFLRFQLRDILTPRLTPEPCIKKNHRQLHSEKTSKLIITERQPQINNLSPVPRKPAVKHQESQSDIKKFYLPSLNRDYSNCSSNASFNLQGLLH